MKTVTSFAFALLIATAASAQIHVDVTVVGKTLDVRDAQNHALASYQISPGLAKHPTPRGHFSIRKIVWNPAWVPPKATWAKGSRPAGPQDPKNPMKIVKIFFKEPDLYIHGTGDENDLGDPASHGCIRMAPVDAYALARTLMQNGGVPENDAWYQKTINGGKTVTVVLRKPVAMTVSK